MCNKQVDPTEPTCTHGGSVNNQLVQNAHRRLNAFVTPVQHFASADAIPPVSLHACEITF